jgi:hypothetical protein
MKNIFILVIALILNLCVLLSLSGVELADKTLCRGFKAKSYTHIGFNIWDAEEVKCCARATTMEWCDFAMESPLCEEHLKERIKSLCIEVPVEE